MAPMFSCVTAPAAPAKVSSPDSMPYSLSWGRSRTASLPAVDVIMTAAAGNDTVRLLTQLKEYGMLSGELTLAGAASAVTHENIGAMSGAAEGFVSAAGYAVDVDTPRNKAFVEAFKKQYQTDPDLFGADTY